MSDLLASKKFKASLIGLAIALLCFGANKLGWKVTEEQLVTFLAPVLTYIGAQGIADWGKGAAELKGK